jgi:hypothetical protein
MKEQEGIVAILDALGAARYSHREVMQFLKSRQMVLDLLQVKAYWKAKRGEINSEAVTTFTFNDTVLVVYCTPAAPDLDDVEHFCLLLRKFMVDSLARGILFRGSLAVGRFYVDDDSNTVMGSAVTDAAAWYSAADWVGINATPHATLVVQALLEQKGGDIERVLVNYNVPFKNGTALMLKAVNWPKAFFVKGLRPGGDQENARAKCLSLLTAHGTPKGVEAKQFNSIAFFDHCAALLKKQQHKARRGEAAEHTGVAPDGRRT